MKRHCSLAVSEIFVIGSYMRLLRAKCEKHLPSNSIHPWMKQKPGHEIKMPTGSSFGFGKSLYLIFNTAYLIIYRIIHVL